MRKKRDMRKWRKYFLNGHTQSAGTYAADEAYSGKREFFNKYFFNYQLSRLENYHAFLKKHLSKNEEIFSIASGRSANELYLMEEGYRITCSELEVPDAYKKTKELFPEFNCIKYDALSGPVSGEYDAIICLSLIYLFDKNELLQFFSNVSKSLKKGGCLLLDSAGSPDNFLSFFIHDIILKHETLLKSSLKSISKRKWHRFVVEECGYRRTDEEIIEPARKAGLNLTNQENSAFLNEFSRSYFLNNAIKHCSLCRIFFNYLGKHVPYIRMFKFTKEK